MTTSIDWDLIRPEAREALRLHDRECDKPEKGFALGTLLTIAIWVGIAIGVLGTLIAQHLPRMH